MKRFWASLVLEAGSLFAYSSRSAGSESCRQKAWMSPAYRGCRARTDRTCRKLNIFCDQGAGILPSPEKAGDEHHPRCSSADNLESAGGACRSDQPETKHCLVSIVKAHDASKNALVMGNFFNFWFFLSSFLLGRGRHISLLSFLVQRLCV